MKKVRYNLNTPEVNDNTRGQDKTLANELGFLVIDRLTINFLFVHL